MLFSIFFRKRATWSPSSIRGFQEDLALLFLGNKSALLVLYLKIIPVILATRTNFNSIVRVLKFSSPARTPTFSNNKKTGPQPRQAG
jgi:hypothetical protein